MADDNRQRDMILAPNEFAYISDETKGDVSAFVGPNKTSLAGTDRPVVFDTKSKKFVQTDLGKAIQTFQTAPEGWYVILKNPADKYPQGNGKQSTPDLKIGKKVNIPGPTTFALWPGQMAKVVQGHNLRSNEYLLVRVYDEKAAQTNLSNMVLKPADPSTSESPDTTSKKSDKDKKATAQVDDSVQRITEASISMGKLFVIRGTDASFYIPPSGIEVVTEVVSGEERYVRQAVSLERLEYCLLLDQDGTKRYVHGPAVVFPRPTETFVKAPIKSSPDKAEAKKFRAQELTTASGIHIRVIADYEEGGKKFTAGQELFITGKEQTIYFPREEHAIIKYGEQEIHYGIAIPEGESRYVLDRDSGVISLEKGPKVFLPDPRRQVIVQRALALHLCSLMYPGNAEALEINAARQGMDDQDILAASAGEALLNNATRNDYESYGATAAVAIEDTARRVMIKGASKALPGDAFNRKNKYTAPRTVVLNTRFDGAVSMTLWTGFATLLVRKNGDRRVVQGPGTFTLEYDESPQVMSLSRGKPKTTDDLLKTVYLLTTANKVSDIVEVETKDFIKIQLKLSYRVNFEGDPKSWFNVDNYVKFLCDHMRSRLRSAVQKIGVEDFYNSSTDLLRDIILGKSTEKGAVRPGTAFSENGMRIYDVEVLGTVNQNRDVENLLVSAKRDELTNTLNLAHARRQLAYIQESEAIKRKINETNAATKENTMLLQAEEAKRKLDLDMILIDAASKTELERITKERAAAEQRASNELSAQQAEAAVQTVALELERKVEVQRLGFVGERQQLELKKIEAEVAAVVEKMKSINPALVEALQGFSDKALVESMTKAIGPMALLGGESVTDILKKVLANTSLASALDKVAPSTNGSTKSKSASA